MTPHEIQALEGVDLEAAVARRITKVPFGDDVGRCNGPINHRFDDDMNVVGWHCINCGHPGDEGEPRKHDVPPPGYLRDWNLLWKVVEVMNQFHYTLDLQVVSTGARAFFRPYNRIPRLGYGIIADTAPVAILRAALWAYEEAKPE